MVSWWAEYVSSCTIHCRQKQQLDRTPPEVGYKVHPPLPSHSNPSSMANEQGEGLTIGKEAGFWKAAAVQAATPPFCSTQPHPSLSSLLLLLKTWVTGR